ncbi:MAG: hypothetical protein C4B58_11340 [Deltaproteobacteria bacterium]|nr:MAG: hypothetical protein C4B58_11340 [Deltaproteobacteria bacterium]
MKKSLLVFGLVILLSGSANAQIVLTPPDTTGTPWHSYYYMGTLYGSGMDPGLRVGHTYTTSYYTWYRSALEFDISGLAGVTPANFVSASLGGLEVSGYGGYYSPVYPGDAMTVNLYDMEDITEDGSITAADYDSVNGPAITTLFNAIPAADTSYDNIDVTSELSNDLFGAGVGNWSGFVLISPDADQQWISFEETAPTLTINLAAANVPTLTEWGTIIFAIFLAGISIRQLRRIRKTA